MSDNGGERKVTIGELTRHLPQIETTPAPVSRGNRRGVWPIIYNGETITVKSPGTMTHDYYSLVAAEYLDQIGVDRSIAMRFGLTFFALLLGCNKVKVDVIFKITSLLDTGKIPWTLMGTARLLLRDALGPPAQTPE
jgi:hypothetical protein